MANKSCDKALSRLSAQVEGFRELFSEAGSCGMLERHWRKLALFQDRVPLRPQVDHYLRREALGEFFSVALRCEGRLAGYWWAFCMPGLHYGSTITSHMDIFWVEPEIALALPVAPLVLLRAVEEELRCRGAQVWYAGEKLSHPCGRLFKSQGFRPVECIWVKPLWGD